MSILESMIQAARCPGLATHATLHARRVILTLAESLPESAVEKAKQTFNAYPDLKIETLNDAWRAAIIAALKEIAGETP
jgi:hypothetical protein